jgi:hypothetical protein
MGSFFSLFDCESSGGNRRYEDQFQLFVVSRDKELNLQLISQPELERRVARARNEPSDHAAVMVIARLLGTSLEPEAYDLYVRTIGLAVAIAIFFDGAVETPDESTDFKKLIDFHYRKYCLFKFASFLDLLHPGLIHWRGQAELNSAPIVCEGLDRFRAAKVSERTLMLSRWIQNPALSAFSEKRGKQSEMILRRRFFLLQLKKLPAAQVAKQLDDAGFKPQRKYSYTAWFHANPNSFQSWLSRERLESGRVWKM